MAYDPNWVSERYQNQLRTITMDEYKVVIALNDMINAVLNRWDKEVSITNEDGKYIITKGNKLNAIQVEVQNAVENFDESMFSQAKLLFLSRNLRPVFSNEYVEMAEAVIDNAVSYEDVTDVAYNAEGIADFADLLYDSESYGDAAYHAAQNEFQFFREERNEDRRELSDDDLPF
jgi:hypothetical protein